MYIIINEESCDDRLSFLITLIALFAFLFFSLICVKKFNFVSRNRPRCFHIFFFTIGQLLKKTVPWIEKTSTCVCFEVYRLNNIFRWEAHRFIFNKSSLRDCDVVLGSRTTKKVKCYLQTIWQLMLILQVDHIGPSMEPWGTPALIWHQFDNCPLRASLWNLSLKNDCISQ